MTRLLVFNYIVVENDNSKRLDYVDTRLHPYNLPSFQLSLALNTDVNRSFSGRAADHPNRPRRDDVFLLSLENGGIFYASEIGLKLPADTTLPLPREPGSLSVNSNIVISTSSPQVIKVYTPVPNGAYSAGVLIPIYLKFDFPVVVSGCPKLRFVVSNIEKFAFYDSGSGTTDLLFNYRVTPDDYIFGLDYYSRTSLHFDSCLVNDVQMYSDSSLFWIRRLSMAPMVIINKTLPWVTYRETVIAPTSLTGSGYYISLSGVTALPVEVSSSPSERPYSFGDLLEFYVKFSNNVKVNDSLRYINVFLKN